MDLEAVVPNRFVANELKSRKMFADGDTFPAFFPQFKFMFFLFCAMEVQYCAEMSVLEYR